MRFRKGPIVSFLSLLIAGSSPFVAGAAAQTDQVFSVLSYNVHGLPPLVSRDGSAGRAAAIGWLASKYDIILLQEDFEYYGQIGSQIRHRTRIRGNGMGWDPRRVAVKVLLAPLGFLIPRFWPPYGSGLTTYVGSELLLPDDLDRVSYDVCGEWLGDTADCWAAKGYLRVGIGAPGGPSIHVYNTHLEAGDTKDSLETRRKQLALLAKGIEEQSAGRALILGGDFNLAFNRPGDGEAMADFRRRLGLEDCGAGPELPYWRQRDYILFRNGSDVTLHVEAMGEAKEFVNDGFALSDHPAIFARFRIEPSTGEETAE